MTSPEGLQRCYTPDPLALACLELMETFVGSDGTWFEPCVGGGAFARAAATLDLTLVTNDLDPDAAADWHKDYRDIRDPVWSRFQGIITNPPFTLAFDLLKAAQRNHAPVGLLLRNTFLAGTKDRGPWLWDNPPRHVARILPRPKFPGPDQKAAGSDMAEYDFVIWDWTSNPQTTFSFIKWREFPKAKA